MLILTRKLDETLHIGDDVTVTVLRIDRGQVRLGITAPAHVRVDREEVYQRRRAERAAGNSPKTGGSP
jgi:carbon storage regulator